MGPSRRHLGRRFVRRATGLTGICAGLVLAWAPVPSAAAASQAMATGHSVAIYTSGQTGSGCTANVGGQGSAYCYLPEVVSANGGDTVTWTNYSTSGSGPYAGSVTHTVVRCDASACPSVGPGNGPSTGTNPPNFDSGNIGGGGTSPPVTFNSAGTYNYYCKIHGWSEMHGSVTVTGSVPGPPSPTPTPTHSNPPPQMHPSPSPAAARAPSPSPSPVAPSPSPSPSPEEASPSPSPTSLASGNTGGTGGGGPGIALVIGILAVVAAGGGAFYYFTRVRAGS